VMRAATCEHLSGLVGVPVPVGLAGTLVSTKTDGFPVCCDVAVLVAGKAGRCPMGAPGGT
jgi:hypothetical protein